MWGSDGSERLRIDEGGDECIERSMLVRHPISEAVATGGFKGVDAGAGVVCNTPPPKQLPVTACVACICFQFQRFHVRALTVVA
mmetsp:Transcript_73694/g.163790  ORF Transcript_73694/g.163790 Transcript_73694/m.163790 type:complete len:84 (+) Transcript_73694:269-520(+)